MNDSHGGGGGGGFTHCIFVQLRPGEVVLVEVVPAQASVVAWRGPDPRWETVQPAGQSHLCEVM